MEKVLVTGASGYIAEHCIIELLKNGYAVKGSLRSMNREQEVRTAIKIAIDDSNLEFCELDLLKDDGWSDAMVDCDFVMHLASPLSSKIQKMKMNLLNLQKKEPLELLMRQKQLA